MAVRDMVGGDGLSNVKFMIWISGNSSVFRLCFNGEGRIQGRIARSVSAYVCWWPELRHTATVTHTLAVSLASARTKSHILRRILLTQLLFIYLPVTTQKSLLGWSNRAKNQLWCQFPAVTVSWQLPPSSIGTQIQIHRFMSAVLSL